MRQHRRAAVTLESAPQPRPEHDRARERHEAADAVDDRRAGEVVEAHAERREVVAVAAHGREPAVRTPRPVAEDRVDEARDADAVDQVADETGAADHRAGGDRRAGVRECVLEDPEREERDARRAVGGRRVLQEEELGAEPRRARAEHEREAPSVEEEAAEARVDDAFHQYVHRLA